MALYVEVIERAGYRELGGLELDDILRENRWLEWIQIGLLLVTALLGAGAFASGQPVLHRLLVLAAVFAMCRELDSFLEDLAFDGLHTMLMGAVLIAMAAVAWPGRDELRRAVPEFLKRPGFYMMFFGLMLVAIYAQIFGQRGVWELLAPDDTSEAKRFVEEGLELAGYLLIGCGVFEERFFGARRVKALTE